MGLDIRFPVGIMFTLIGLLLSITALLLVVILLFTKSLLASTSI